MAARYSTRACGKHNPGRQKQVPSEIQDQTSVVTSVHWEDVMGLWGEDLTLPKAISATSAWLPEMVCPIELCLSICSAFLDTDPNLTFLCGLWLLLLFLCYLVGIPSLSTFWKTKAFQKRKGTAKRRRKGGTSGGWRRYKRETEDIRKLISILKSPSGQHHDTTRFRQLLCPDPSCEVCNNTTAEVNRLLFLEDLEDDTLSVSSLASTASVTESSFTLSSAFSEVPPGGLTPAPPPEPSPPPPSILSPKPMTPLELRPDYQLNSSEKMLGSIADKHDSAFSLPLWNSKGKPKELLVHQQPPYPKASEDHLQQKHVQLFWGLPSMHSESLAPADHVSGDCSSIFIFTTIFNASTSEESPVLSHPLPLFSPEMQPQALPQTLPQYQPLPLTQVQPQAHLQSPLPILPSGPLPETQICGVCFHRPQNESESVISSEIEQLEWNVLQKQRESLWGLSSVVQRSREDFHPSAPSSPYLQASQAHVSTSILPGEFPLSDELRKKLDHHLRKRLIQHRLGLPHRIHESLSLMMPLRDFSEIPESEHNHGHSCVSLNKNLNGGLSHPGSFRERVSEMLQQEKDVGKDQGHSSENGPKAHLLSDPESSSDSDLGCDSEKDLTSHMASLSGKNSRASSVSLDQKQFKNVLDIQLSKKFEEINGGQVPGTVHSSWHAIKQSLQISVKSHTQITQRSLPPSVGGDYVLNTFQDLSFIDYSTRQTLEAHIRSFRMRMLWGLPRRVLESIEIFTLKGAASESLSHSYLPSSANLISEVDSKSGGLEPLRGSSKPVHQDKAGTINSAPVLDRSHPTTSPMGREGQGTFRQSPSGMNQELAEDVKGARQTLLPVTHGITGKASQRLSPLGNRYPPKLPARQAEARHEPKGKSVSSRDGVETRQGKKTDKSEPSAASREIFRAKELNALQSKTGNIFTTSKPGNSQMMTKVETTRTTERPSPKRPVPQDPKSSGLKEQLFGELKFKLEKRNQNQVQGQPTDRSLASESLTYKAPLTHAQGVSTGDMGASQVLRAHLEDRVISVEQQQEPWVPREVLRRGQDKDFPPAAKTASPLGPKAEELGGGDAGLGTSQPRRKIFFTQNKALEETVGNKSSQTPSQKGQPPPESLFRKKMNHILQWLHPGTKGKSQENSQEKGSPVSLAQSRGPVKKRAALTGMTTAQKTMMVPGKFPEEKSGRWHATDVTCPQEPLPSPRKFGRTQRKAEVLARADPIQGHPSNYRAPTCKVTKKPCHQEAVFAGQSDPANSRRIRDEDGHPQKVVAFRNQLADQCIRAEPREEGKVEHREVGEIARAKQLRQLLSELKFQLESEEHSQAQDMSFISDSLPSQSSLTQYQSISSGDTGVSQVLHVHLENTGISMEQQQEPWVSKCVSWKFPNKNFSSAAKRVRPLKAPKQENVEVRTQE
ncbi:spermatogenesis-associated protein 31D1-like [Equus asinus]|uniref:spermatogenesis-associated protein 31D1-like n=1 Tax=Equus asinus TaxID=9793 RepID=UPI0038F68968